MVQMSWLGLVKETATRRQGPKDGANLVFTRFIPEPNGTAHRANTKAAARTAIALDIETHKTTGEIPPSLAEAAERIKAQGWAGIAYTSHSHTAAAPRYRIILPQSAEIPPHLPAVEVVAEILGLSGVLDRSKLGPASLFYLPSAEPGGLGDHASISIDGAPIDATWIQDRAGAVLAAREAEQRERREKALAAAEATRAAKIAAGFKPNENLIEAIRDRLDLAAELLRHGYTPTGNRYLYPGSETGVPGVHILRGSDGVERVFSHHANDPLAAGNLPSWCNVAAVDVVDVVTILDHGGDRKAALHKLAKQFGIESNRRQAAEPPPEWDDVPPPDCEPEVEQNPPVQDQTSEKASLHKIHVLTPAQCCLEPPRQYIIKNLIARGDHGGLIGLPGSAKSTLAPYIGYRTALGLDVFGHRTIPVPVLYIAAEDGTGMKQRVRALYERMGDAPGFLLQPVPVDFLTPGGTNVTDIEELIRVHKPGLVIVDTVARSFPGLKENDPDAMAQVVKVARGFSMICDSAVLSLHHPPKDSVTPRGHSVLNGDFDVTFYLEGERAEHRTVTMGKNRNGPSDLSFGFGLVAHNFPPDADGDPVTAPVAEPANNTFRASAVAAKESRLSDKPAVMLRELRSLLDRDGAFICPGSDFPTVRAVSRSALRNRLIERGWFSDDVLCTALEGHQTIARKGYATENNALTPLKRNGFVAFNRDWIWLV
jgi:hypothetical protein